MFRYLLSILFDGCIYRYINYNIALQLLVLNPSTSLRQWNDSKTVKQNHLSYLQFNFLSCHVSRCIGSINRITAICYGEILKKQFVQIIRSRFSQEMEYSANFMWLKDSKCETRSPDILIGNYCIEREDLCNELQGELSTAVHILSASNLGSFRKLCKICCMVWCLILSYEKIGSI